MFPEHRKNSENYMKARLKTLCYDEGTIQAYIDGELKSDEKEKLEKHMKCCIKCRKMYDNLKSNDNFVRSTLKADIPDIDYIRNNIKMKKERKGAFFMHKYKKFISIAAMLVFVLASIYIVPVQKAEAKILSIFRISKFQTVNLSMDDIQKMQSEFNQKGLNHIDLKQYGKVTSDLSPMSTYATLDEFKKNSDFNIKLPSYIPASYDIQGQINAQNEERLDITPNVDSINSLIKSFGGKTFLPNSVNGKTFTIKAGNTVNINYLSSSNPDDTINIGITKVPDINVPDGVDINSIRSAIINLPFLPDDIQRQLQSIDDWKNTIPVPVDADHQKSQNIDINGNEGILITSSTTPSYTDIAWIENGVIYGVNSTLPQSEVIKIAKSFK